MIVDSLSFSWAALSKQLKSPLLLNHSLQRFTSWRVGGPGEAVLIPESLDDISLVLKFCPVDVPVTWLGLGSNVLIRDEGIRGLVIVTQGSVLSEICLLGGEGSITSTCVNVCNSLILFAEAGVPCGQLARFSARNNLRGIEFLAGIPGTVGGALRMNAGCYGGETWDHVTHVKTIDRFGVCHLRAKEEFVVRYREVSPCGLTARSMGEYFLGAYFQLLPGNKEESLLKIKTMLDQRNQSQPTNLPNCGSVFKNPPDNHAAALIQACGLKGYRIGGAQISEKHANFIVNINNASSRDVLDLIALAKEKVKEKFDIELEQEVKVM